MEKYHSHPNYFIIWVGLLVILIASLGIGIFGIGFWTVSLIFLLAAVKATMVLGWFMHLRWEPRLVWAITGFGILCMMFLFFGVYPDIVPVELKIAQ